MNAAEQLAQDVGTSKACDALDVSRASLYRQRDRQTKPARDAAPKRPSSRALPESEREQVRQTLYVILDIYSRYVVGWMLAHCEQAKLASKLIRETVENQNVCEDELIIHSDRGPSMTSHSVSQLLISLGVTKSHSRPHVSNDNPFSESQFKTMKYQPVAMKTA